MIVLIDDEVPESRTTRSLGAVASHRAALCDTIPVRQPGVAQMITAYWKSRSRYETSVEGASEVTNASVWERHMRKCRS